MMTPDQDIIGESKVKIPTTIPYLFTFLLLTFLCYETHEMFHHLVAGVLCGGFGTLTLTAYIPRPQCNLDYVVTLSGPLVSFAITWSGVYLLLQHRHMLFAYTLIFAGSAHLRFPLPIRRSGDEWLVARMYFHDPNQFLLAGILFLLALPALVYAYRSIANQKHLLIFLVSWFLPFTILFSLPYVDGWVLGSDPGWAHPTLIGVPVIVWAVNLTALVIFTFAGNRIPSQHTMCSVKSEHYRHEGQRWMLNARETQKSEGQ